LNYGQAVAVVQDKLVVTAAHSLLAEWVVDMLLEQ
jgi:hypothetical protein